eukprot:TRINITY_DN1896_c0_g1_i1.p1 TRINITY_DN1896_c0_g1~~TRINITY_DN1896_c0_g1_i1.p1  ORF type:complete len:226 (-),score=72.37 TRINITY_DN1896_c0_g1_i1:16-693(-)
MSTSKPKSELQLHVTGNLYEYLLKVGVREDEVLKELRETSEKHEKARMQTSPDEVQFLRLLLQILNAQKVIEVGVFTGHGTLAMALSLPKDGKLYALDISEEFTSIGKPFWKKAGVENIIDLRIAPAVETLDKLLETETGQIDFAFIDADKNNYDQYYERLLKLVRKGGIIAIDNTLWGGKVIDEKANDDDTIAIRKLNEKIQNDNRVNVSMLGIADGLTLCYVK